ncbi:hypothetical protein [Polymorphospora rubra]|uniref:hypothetical protein n=1 Tax=Polymorphospora rubra TaxID=338584 RepID=UPI0031D58BA2
MSARWARRAFSHPALTGISGNHLNLLQSRLYPLWIAGREGRLHSRRSGHRQRAAGAGRPLVLGSVDWLVMTLALAHLSLGIPHQALAVAFGVAVRQ